MKQDTDSDSESDLSTDSTSSVSDSDDDGISDRISVVEKSEAGASTSICHIFTSTSICPIFIFEKRYFLKMEKKLQKTM